MESRIRALYRRPSRAALELARSPRRGMCALWVPEMTVTSVMGVSRRQLVISSGAVALFIVAAIVNGCGARDCNETATCPIVGDDALVANDSAADASGDATDGDDSSDGSFETGDTTADANDTSLDMNDDAADGNDGAADGPTPVDAGADADGGPDAQPEAAPDGPRCGSSPLPLIAAVALSSTTHMPSEAIDRNFTTRWESNQGSDPEWIYVDLGARVFINRVQIAWLTACASNYDLQVSNDASTWTIMQSISGNSVGGGSPSSWTTGVGSSVVDHQGLTGVGRYLRVFGKNRCNPSFGYSMWEIQVSGDTNPNCAQ